MLWDSEMQSGSHNLRIKMWVGKSPVRQLPTGVTPNYCEYMYLNLRGAPLGSDHPSYNPINPHPSQSVSQIHPIQPIQALSFHYLTTPLPIDSPRPVPAHQRSLFC
jgi:hypothetical protein